MALRLQEISHRFGATKVLSGVSLSVSSGEIVCLFGPSGCGKTTLLRLIAGLEELRDGEIWLGDTCLASNAGHVPAERRAVGFVFQDYVLFPHLTALQNVAFGLSGQAEKKVRAQAALASVGLEGLEGRYPHQMSGGQQQRVALARATVTDPRALLLDEPFASIDVVRRKNLRESLRLQLKAQDIPTVLVTHDPEEAIEMGDRIAVMSAGSILEIGTTFDLAHHAKSIAGASLVPGTQTLKVDVENGTYRSRFGQVAPVNPSVEHADTCVIMPEGVSVRAATGGPCRVVDCRFNGESFTVFLAPRDLAGDATVGQGSEETLRAKSQIPLDIGTDVIPEFVQPRLRFFADGKAVASGSDVGASMLSSAPVTETSTDKVPVESS